MRVVSLLPAATEIVGALDLMDLLVGVSHECDFPVEVNSKPRITRCEIHESGLASAVIDNWVTKNLSESETLYTMDEKLLRELAPDVILTQRLCDVCAVGYGSVTEFATTLQNRPEVVNLEPTNLEGIFDDIRRVAAALGKPERADPVLDRLKKRVEAVRTRAESALTNPRCFLMEWIDPPFCSGHWGPELVELAGGIDVLGRKGEKSARITKEDVVKAAPDIIVVSCCGFTVKRTLEELPLLKSYPGWETMPAVKNGHVYIVDGSSYFSRPGPRTIDSLEILAEIFHPGLFSNFPHRGVVRVAFDDVKCAASMFDSDGALSRDFLVDRGFCCENGCRNCPYGFTSDENG